MLLNSNMYAFSEIYSFLNKEVKNVKTRKYVVTCILKTKDLKIENIFGKQYHLKIVYRHYLTCFN